MSLPTESAYEDKPFLSSSISASPQHPYDFPKPHRPVGKTLLLVILALVHLGCNAAVLVVSFHTYRFGARITKDTWMINDTDLISAISFGAKALSVITTVIGGWAISYFWSRRLSHPRSTAGLAELQSLTIFQSVPTIFDAVHHLLYKQYISSQWLYAAIITCAILLQFYSPAVIALATPSLSLVEHRPRCFAFDSPPFMEAPNYSGRCQSVNTLSDSAKRSCLGVTLSGGALNDVETFDGTIPWDDPSSPWLEVDTSYTMIDQELLIGAALPIGPVQGSNFSAGAEMYGVNMAALRVLTDVNATLGHSIWDSVEFRIDVNATMPVLGCQCARGPSDTSTITIQGVDYDVPASVPLLPNDSIAAQVTTDNMTLVFSIPHDNSTNTHCAINLLLQDMYMVVVGSNSSVGPVPQSLVVFPVLDKQDLSLSPPKVAPMRDFSDLWLLGLGWSSTPSPSPVVGLLQEFPIGTGNNDGDSFSLYLEEYMLVMLANGISAGFSTYSPTSICDMNRLWYSQKWEYYLGLTSRWQYFLITTVILDTIFILFCAGSVLAGGWYPDWTDPVTLARVALSSTPPGMSSLPPQHEHLSLYAQSPVALVIGENVDKKLWKEEYSLAEVKSGGRNYLVLRKVGPDAPRDPTDMESMYSSKL